MPSLLTTYAVSLGIMLGFDVAWLGLTSERIYRPQMGSLMRDSINIVPAALFYLIYAVAVAALVVSPALARGDARSALIPGLLLGLAAYGTYNFTNASILKGWPVALTFIDLAWGTFVTGATAYLATLALSRLTSG